MITKICKRKGTLEQKEQEHLKLKRQRILRH